MKLHDHPLLVFLISLGLCSAQSRTAAPPSLPAATPDSEESAKRLVVMVRSRLGELEQVGAGIIVGFRSDRIYIATANHVVRQGVREDPKPRVVFWWLNGEPFEANLLTLADPKLDLAVLSVPNLRAVAMPRLAFDRLADVSLLNRGSDARSVGCPKGDCWKPRITPDKIARVSSDILQFESASLAQGHSGGALVNERWEIAGMIVRDADPGEAVHIDRIIEKLKEWNYPVMLSRASERARDVVPATVPPQTTPSETKTVRRALTLAAGNESTCAVTPGGGAYCWGSNQSGQLGSATARPGFHPVMVSGGLEFRLIRHWSNHACGITLSGAAYCWGNNQFGQLGNGALSHSPAPVLVAGDLNFRTLATGGYHTCGVTTDSAVYCWGANRDGQLGNRSFYDSPVPVLAAGGMRFRLISAGGHFTCGIGEDGYPYCWGSNRDGQLGANVASPSPVPVRVEANASFRTVAAGGNHACGVTTERTVWCWGSNHFGQLGFGRPSAMGAPAPLRLAGLVGVNAGTNHTCAISSDQDALCWGSNRHGQLGDGTKDDRPFPTPVSGRLKFRVVYAGGGEHTCGVTATGAAYCWGANHFGQLGANTGSMTISTAPVPVALPQ